MPRRQSRPVTLRAPAEEPIARAEPLRTAVYDRVVSRIRSGEFRPGDAVTEAGLSRSLRVSRTPVREALLRLQAEGVLESALARGFTIRPLLRREAAELYPILAVLEGLAVRSIGSLRASTARTLRATAAELGQCHDPVRRRRLDTSFHATIVAAADNRHLTELTEQLRTSLSRYELAYMREVPDRHHADRQHEDVLAAIMSKDPGRAADLLSDHWHESMRSILAWLDDQDDS
jgi:DNA-binding GntR family transcriptional regulator